MGSAAFHRANTIIVDRADLFGLSQLYQLRGRVGRANERAYAYLLVPPVKSAERGSARADRSTRTLHRARLRLSHRDFDMELRGAGCDPTWAPSRVGSSRDVGFELFCTMLEDATHELRGETVTNEVDPDLNFDVEALLPEDYIAEVGVRLSLYKRLSSAGDEAEVNDLVAKKWRIASVRRRLLAQPLGRADAFQNLSSRLIARRRLRGDGKVRNAAPAPGYAARSAQGQRARRTQKKSLYRISSRTGA